MMRKIFVILLIAAVFMFSSISTYASDPQLDYEHELLSFEKTFLQNKLQYMEFERDISEAWIEYFNAISVRYSNQLVAVKALDYCNRKGMSIGEILEMLNTEGQTDIECLKKLRQYPYNYLKSAIRNSAKTNPTLAFLTADLSGTQSDYEDFYIQFGLRTEKFGALKTEEAMDIYLRLANMVIANDNIFRTQASQNIMISSRFERDGIRTLSSCIDSMSDANPFERIAAKTKSKNSVKLFDNPDFKINIPCIDNKATVKEKKEAYIKLFIGMYGLIYNHIHGDSDNNANEMKKNLKRYITILDEVEILEKRYLGLDYNSVQADKFFSHLPSSMHKIVFLYTYTNRLGSGKLETISIGKLDAISTGIERCGEGFTRSIFTKEGVRFLVIGSVVIVATMPGIAAAAPAGATVVAASGSIMLLGAGAYFTADTGIDLYKYYDEMSVEEISEKGCSFVLQGGFTITGLKGFKAYAKNVAKPMLAELKYTGTGIPEIKAGWTGLKSRFVDKNYEKLASRLSSTEIKSAQEPVDAGSKPLVEWIKENIKGKKNQQKAMGAVTGHFAKMTYEQQQAFMEIWKEYGQEKNSKKGLDKVIELRRKRLYEYKENPDMYKIWKDTDVDILRMLNEPAKEWKPYKKVYKAAMDPKRNVKLTEHEDFQLEYPEKHLDVLIEALFGSRDFAKAVQNLAKNKPKDIIPAKKLEYFFEISRKSTASDDFPNGMLDKAGIEFIQNLNQVSKNKLILEKTIEAFRNFAKDERFEIDFRNIKSLKVKAAGYGHMGRIYKITVKDSAGKEHNLAMKKGLFEEKEVSENNLLYKKRIGIKEYLDKPISITELKEIDFREFIDGYTNREILDRNPYTWTEQNKRAISSKIHGVLDARILSRLTEENKGVISADISDLKLDNYMVRIKEGINTPKDLTINSIEDLRIVDHGGVAYINPSTVIHRMFTRQKNLYSGTNLYSYLDGLNIEFETFEISGLLKQGESRKVVVSIIEEAKKQEYSENVPSEIDIFIKDRGMENVKPMTIEELEDVLLKISQSWK